MSDRTFRVDLPRMGDVSPVVEQTAVVRAGLLTLFKYGHTEYSAAKHTFRTITCGVILSGRVARGSRLKLGDAHVFDPYQLRPGDISFNPAGCDLETEVTQQSGMEAIAINWDIDAANSIDEFSAAALESIRPQPAFHDPLIDMTFRTLRNTFSSLQTTNRLFADTAAAMILARLVSFDGRGETLGRKPSGLAPWQLKRTTEYMMEHLSSPVSLAELASIANLSQAQFGRAFKRSMGMPPHQWQLEQRITRAQRMLTETDLPIGSIALACGFEDQLYFSKLFRRRLGSSPRAWRLFIRS